MRSTRPAPTDAVALVYRKGPQLIIVEAMHGSAPYNPASRRQLREGAGAAMERALKTDLNFAPVASGNHGDLFCATGKAASHYVCIATGVGYFAEISLSGTYDEPAATARGARDAVVHEG